MGMLTVRVGQWEAGVSHQRFNPFTLDHPIWQRILSICRSHQRWKICFTIILAVGGTDGLGCSCSGRSSPAHHRHTITVHDNKV